MPGAKYARGSQAWALCQRCGLRFLLMDLVFDGFMPGLRVCSGCFDTRQPQEFLVDVTDPIALWKPAPDSVAFTPPILYLIQAGPPVKLAWTSAYFGAYTTGRYLVWRAVPGSPYVLLATFNNVYDIFQDGNPPTPVSQPGMTETLMYTDASVVADPFNYYIEADSLVTTYGVDDPKIILSNVIQAVVP
jgi:hypothetical protein